MDLALKQGPNWLDEHMVVRGLKAASYPFRSTLEYQGYGYMELDGPGFHGDGFKSRVFVPKQLTKEPELFWGPFLQLGTYLKGQGMIDSDGLALAMDIALDPTNLLTSGTFGLLGKATKGAVGATEVAKVARLFGAMSEGGRIKNYGEAVKNGLDTLEQAWKLSGFRDEILAAGKAGDKGAVKKIVDAARSTGRLTETQSQILSGLRRDRGHLATILEHLDDFKDQALRAEDITQGTLAEKLAAGQVRPFVGLAKPWERLRKGQPIRFAAEMAGFHFADTEFWFPAAGLTAGVLDKLKLGGLAKTAADFEAVSGMRMAPKIEAARAGFEAGASVAKATDIPAWQTVMAIEGLKVMVGAQDEHLAKLIGGDVFGKGQLEREFRALHGVPDKESLTSVEHAPVFERYREDRISQMAKVYRRFDDEALKRRRTGMALAAGEMEAMAGPVQEAQAVGILDQVTAGAAGAQLRKIQEAFGLRTLQYDLNSPGMGLSARSGLTTLMARVANSAVRATLKQAYPERAVREVIDEVWRSVIEHPGEWEKRAGRYAYIGKLDESKAAFLKRAIQNSRASSKTAGLEKHLVEVGLDERLSYVIDHIREAHEMVGSNLLQLRILDGLKKDYFSRLFRVNAKGRKALKGGEDLPAALSRVFSQDAEGQTFERMAGISFRDAQERVKQGVVTLAEHRHYTEAEFVALAEHSYGDYEKSSTILFSAYMDAAGQAVLFSRLFRDLPDIAPAITPAAVASRYGWEAAGRISKEDYAKAKRVMRGEVPAAFRGMMHEVVSQPLGTLERDQPGLVAALARERQLRTLARSDGWQRAIEDEGLRIKKHAEGLQLAALRGGIAELEKADIGLKSLGKATARASAMLEHALAANVRRGVEDIQRSEKGILAAYKGASDAWTRVLAHADDLETRSLQLQLDVEELARQRVAKSLAGKKQVGGFTIMMRGSKEPVPFDPDWLINGSYPEGIVGTKQLKKITHGMLQRELSALVEASAIPKLEAAKAALLEKAEGFAVKAQEVVAGANAAMDKHMARIEAAEKAAGKVAAGAERRLAAQEARLKQLAPATDMTELRKKLTKGVAPFQDSYDRARALEQQSRKVGKWTLRARLARSRGEAKELAEGAIDRTRRAQSVWVFEPDHAHLQDAFRLYEGGKPSAFWDQYDRWNYRFKSLVLLGDVFHFNVLAISQFLTTPEKFLKLLIDDAGKLVPGAEAGANFLRPNVALASVAGAGVGGVIGGLRGGDHTETTGFSIAGALYGATIAAALKNSKRALRTALNPENIDSLLMMGLGGWSGRPDDRSIGILNAGLKTLRDRFAGDPANHFLVDPIDKARHVMDWWDDTLWETLHNGSKHYYFQVKWEQELAKLQKSPGWGDEALKAEFMALRGLNKPELPDDNIQAAVSQVSQRGSLGGLGGDYSLLHTPTSRAMDNVSDTAKLLVAHGLRRTEGEARKVASEVAQGWSRAYQVSKEAAEDLGFRLHVFEPDDVASNAPWGFYDNRKLGNVFLISPTPEAMVGALNSFEKLGGKVLSAADAGRHMQAFIMTVTGHEMLHATIGQHPNIAAKVYKSVLSGLDTGDLTDVAEKIAKRWGLARETAIMAGGTALHQPPMAKQIAEELRAFQKGGGIGEHGLLRQLIDDAVGAAQGKTTGASATNMLGGVLNNHFDPAVAGDPLGQVAVMVMRALEEGVADSAGGIFRKEGFWRDLAKDATPAEKGVLAKLIDAIIAGFRKLIDIGTFGSSEQIAPAGTKVRGAFDQIAEELTSYRKTYLLDHPGDIEQAAKPARGINRTVTGMTPGAPRQPVGIELTKSDDGIKPISRAFRELGWLPPSYSRVIAGPGLFYASPQGAVRLEGHTLVVDAHPQTLGDVFDFLAHLEEKGGAQAKRLAEAVNFAVNRQALLDAVGQRQLEWVKVRELADGTLAPVLNLPNRETPAIFKRGERPRAKKTGTGARVQPAAGAPEGAGEAVVERGKQSQDRASAALEYTQRMSDMAPRQGIGSVLSRLPPDKAAMVKPIVDKAAERLPESLQDAWAHMAPAELGGRGLSPKAYGLLRSLEGQGAPAATQANEARRRLYRALVTLQGDIARDMAGPDALPSMPPAFAKANIASRPPIPPIKAGGWKQGEFDEFSRQRRWQMKTELARQIVHMSNTVFGGQTWRYLLDRPEFQHIARRFLLSPDWTSSRLALSANMLMNIDPGKQAVLGGIVGQAVEYADAGGDPDKAFSGRGPVFGAAMGLAMGKWGAGIQRRLATKGDFVAKESRRLAAAALMGGYVFANALNMAFTGHFMWDNPEGKKTSINIGQGDFVSLGKPWVETFEYAGVYEKENYPIPVISRLSTKQAVLPLQYVRLFSNSNRFGGTLMTGDDTALDIGKKAFSLTIQAASPIIFQGPLRYAEDALTGQQTGGDISTAMLRSAGFRVSSPIQYHSLGGTIGAVLSGRPGLRDSPETLGGL